MTSRLAGYGPVRDPVGRARVHGAGTAANSAVLVDPQPKVPGARLGRGERSHGDGPLRHPLLLLARPPARHRTQGVRGLGQPPTLFRYRNLRLRGNRTGEKTSFKSLFVCLLGTHIYMHG